MGRFKRIAACVFAAVLGSAAQADTITFDTTLPGVGFETLSGFDSSLGKLTAATITISGLAETFISVDTTGPVIESFAAFFRIEGPFGLVAEDIDTAEVVCGAQQACIETRILSATATVVSTFTEPADLSALTGVGLPFEVVSASGDRFTGSASVTYTFAPVPLPAGLPLLLLGIGGLALVRGRAGLRR